LITKLPNSISTIIAPSDHHRDPKVVLNLELLRITGEAALAISALLAAISDKFDDLYVRQIQRASRSRRRTYPLAPPGRAGAWLPAGAAAQLTITVHAQLVGAWIS
jgi:hypothetical protein